MLVLQYGVHFFVEYSWIGCLNWLRVACVPRSSRVVSVVGLVVAKPGLA